MRTSSKLVPEERIAGKRPGVAILSGDSFQCRSPSNAVTCSVRWQKHPTGRNSRSTQIAGLCVCKVEEVGTA